MVIVVAVPEKAEEAEEAVVEVVVFVMVIVIVIVLLHIMHLRIEFQEEGGVNRSTSSKNKKVNSINQVYSPWTTSAV